MKKKPGSGRQRGAAFTYQLDSRYVAQIAEDLKEAVMEELAKLGAKEITPDFGSIHFRADKKTLCAETQRAMSVKITFSRQQ